MTDTNVNTAFRKFMTHAVRLDPARTKTARGSRDWLVGQISALPFKDGNFPLLWDAPGVHFGSFARRTKARPLNDVDLMIVMKANGIVYNSNYDNTYSLFVPDGHRLRRLCHPGTDQLNSRLVVNQFLTSLREIHYYKQAESKRNGAAAVLSLTSHEWVFDIVPCFFTDPEEDGRTFYLIPDGNGSWIKTDPRIDKERATTINQNAGGYVLDAIRLFKHWAVEKHGVNIGSYLIETMILSLYEDDPASAQKYQDANLTSIFLDLSNTVRMDVQDPKNIDGNINRLDFFQRKTVSEKLDADYDKAVLARKYEDDSRHDMAIKLWKQILGEDFGEYDD